VGWGCKGCGAGPLSHHQLCALAREDLPCVLRGLGLMRFEISNFFSILSAVCRLIKGLGRVACAQVSLDGSTSIWEKSVRPPN